MTKPDDGHDEEPNEDLLGEEAIEEIARMLFLASHPARSTPSAWEELPEPAKEKWRWEAWRRARNYR